MQAATVARGGEAGMWPEGAGWAVLRGARLWPQDVPGPTGAARPILLLTAVSVSPHPSAPRAPSTGLGPAPRPSATCSTCMWCGLRRRVPLGSHPSCSLPLPPHPLIPSLGCPNPESSVWHVVEARQV